MKLDHLHEAKLSSDKIDLARKAKSVLERRLRRNISIDEYIDYVAYRAYYVMDVDDVVDIIKTQMQSNPQLIEQVVQHDLGDLNNVDFPAEDKEEVWDIYVDDFNKYKKRRIPQ